MWLHKDHICQVRVKEKFWYSQKIPRRRRNVKSVALKLRESSYHRLVTPRILHLEISAKWTLRHCIPREPLLHSPTPHTAPLLPSAHSRWFRALTFRDHSSEKAPLDSMFSSEPCWLGPPLWDCFASIMEYVASWLYLFSIPCWLRPLSLRLTSPWNFSHLCFYPVVSVDGTR